MYVWYRLTLTALMDMNQRVTLLSGISEHCNLYLRQCGTCIALFQDQSTCVYCPIDHLIVHIQQRTMASRYNTAIWDMIPGAVLQQEAYCACRGGKLLASISQATLTHISSSLHHLTRTLFLLQVINTTTYNVRKRLPSASAGRIRQPRSCHSTLTSHPPAIPALSLDIHPSTYASYPIPTSR
jgi:hypothetical protein